MLQNNIYLILTVKSVLQGLRQTVSKTALALQVDSFPRLLLPSVVRAAMIGRVLLVKLSQCPHMKDSLWQLDPALLQVRLRAFSKFVCCRRETREKFLADICSSDSKPQDINTVCWLLDEFPCSPYDVGCCCAVGKRR